ncbi:hypothetical protein [Tessaracoccus antarcticus]|uniref:NAD-dependent epimerase/dehydratase family protein n=1 Tax=Tessaracoccus antarcticus TaxID=2479848 RepID=A0A3M0GCU4_9ACTN|nr:hypothetical protein [Tessaracoccus antarcticus]RMB58949.1 hypothetical protein EAX62_12665 [Tessaracoccus antarcticus]
MKVFVAGGTGAVGVPLVRRLLAHGDAVTGLTRSHTGAELLRGLGAEAVHAHVPTAPWWARCEVLGPWSLCTSRAFWEGFAPAALNPRGDEGRLRTVFCVEGDWQRAEATVSQSGTTGWIEVVGEGDLDAAATQVCRFLSLDVDARGWPEVGRRVDAEITQRYGPADLATLCQRGVTTTSAASQRP